MNIPDAMVAFRTHAGDFIMIRNTVFGFAAAAALVTAALAPTAASAGYYGHGYGYRSYYQPSYPSYYGGGSSRHVRWCYNRYRTYSARTNTFRGYDGYRHRCRSPYRY